MEIDYAVAGAMALNFHRYRRATTNVDILVRREGAEAFMARSRALGFTPAICGPHRTFRDVDTGVLVFLVCGEYPGDRQFKPVAYPDPAAIAVEIDGTKVVDLPTLVNLKLASGMTAPARLRDLADVQDLIRTLGLDERFADQIVPYVRGTFLTLLQQVRQPDPHREEPRR